MRSAKLESSRKKLIRTKEFVAADFRILSVSRVNLSERKKKGASAMIQDSSRFGGFQVAQPFNLQPVSSEVCKEPIDLLENTGTGTLAWCEKPVSLKDILAATSS